MIDTETNTDGLRMRLDNITLEVTRKCSFRCLHCYNGKNNYEEWDYDRIVPFLEWIREIGTFDISLTGGDVFLYSRFNSLVKKIRDLGFRLNLLTNLFSCDEENIKMIKSLGVNELEFTIFSLDEKVNDTMTGHKGSLQRILKNIDLCKNYGIRLFAKNLITKYDCESYKDFEEFCTKKHIEHNVDYRIVNTIEGDDSNCECMLSADQLLRVLKELDFKQERSFNEPKMTDRICTDSDGACYISATGDVFPCVFLRFNCGNIYKDDYSDIISNLNKSPCKELCWSMLYEKCRKCDIKHYCIKCPGHSMLEGKSYKDYSDQDCMIANIRRTIYGQDR